MKFLTEREKQVIVLVAEGLTAQEVAAELNLSIHTIRSYTKSIIQKLGAKNMTHAVTLSRNSVHST